MKLILALALTLPLSADAGIKSFLERFCRHHIVADDPYQFERLSTPQVIAEYIKEGEKAKRSGKQSQLLRILGEEMRRREFVPAAVYAMGEYFGYEEAY